MRSRAHKWRVRQIAVWAGPTMEHHNTLAILVAGGPTPGINAVIAAATIRARLEGLTVLGIHDGFERIMRGEVDRVTPLTIEAVSRIHFRGGSCIGDLTGQSCARFSILGQRAYVAAAAERDPTHHRRRSRHGLLRDAVPSTGQRSNPLGIRANNSRTTSTFPPMWTHLGSSPLGITASRSSKT